MLDLYFQSMYAFEKFVNHGPLFSIQVLQAKFKNFKLNCWMSELYCTASPSPHRTGQNKAVKHGEFTISLQGPSAAVVPKQPMPVLT